ncbi:MAG: hypothetical protein Fur0010_14100 [Bdellovibrio sp.]
MKNALLLLAMILMLSLNFKAHGSVAVNVKGQLIYEGVVAVTLITEHGEIPLAGHEKNLMTCQEGEFTVVENYAPADSYSIVEVLNCAK